MDVRSSITSSDERIPALPWPRILVPAVVAFALFVVALELALALHGIQPTVTDSEQRWEKERNRASDLGANALIFVGASRMQTDIDLDEARRRTGLEPVQLAVSGANWIPVLQGLASDPEIRGTVVVDYYEKFISSPDADNIVNNALVYQQHFKRHRGNSPPSERSEEWLTDKLHGLLRSYADDATPFQALLDRALSPKRVDQYMSTSADRSRAADFSKAPSTYSWLPYSIKNSGKVIPLSYKSPVNARLAELERVIASLEPEDNGYFIAQTRQLRSMVDSIEQRGGRVFFVAMPESGWLAEMRKKKFPRTRFWDVFVSEVGTTAVDSSEDESLSGFTSPDGSHLDKRDRTNYTAALLTRLGLGK